MAEFYRLTTKNMIVRVRTSIMGEVKDSTCQNNSGSEQNAGSQENRDGLFD